MKPYHLFRQNGLHFAYHVGAGRCVRVTPEAYEMLELRQALPATEAETEFRRRHADAGSVLSDVAALEADGFFDEVDPALPDDGEFKAALEKRLSSPCNNLVLSVSSGCNLACRYCYCGVCRDEIPNQGLMPEETAMRAVDGLFAAADPKSNVRVTFFGGEPLLNKPVVKKVVAECNARAAERGVKASYSITTNATLVDDETAAMIAENNFGLMVSLDGPKALHDSQCPTRDGRGSFDAAAAGIRALMARCDKITVRCTMAHPAPDAMALIRFFADFGFSRVVLGKVHNPAFPSPCDFTAEDDRAFKRQMEEDVLPWMVAEREAGREPIYNPFDDIGNFLGEKEHAEKIDAMRCGACHGAMAVGPDGTLYPCHRFVGMEAWALGKLESGPDRARCEKFWNGYRACMKETCGACWASRICGGPCPWEIAKADGTFEMFPRLCDETRDWICHGAYYFEKTGKSNNPKGEKQQ